MHHIIFLTVKANSTSRLHHSTYAWETAVWVSVLRWVHLEKMGPAILLLPSHYGQSCQKRWPGQRIIPTAEKRNRVFFCQVHLKRKNDRLEIPPQNSNWLKLGKPLKSFKRLYMCWSRLIFQISSCRSGNMTFMQTISSGEAWQKKSEIAMLTFLICSEWPSMGRWQYESSSRALHWRTQCKAKSSELYSISSLLSQTSVPFQL